ncbi:MAG TPA: inositol monophosphatase [Actinomycetota bacterium]|nr:inositol monophosphatase [Actinomycetota bacterium]
MAPPSEIQARLDWATRTAEQAGELLLASFRTDVAVERKDRGIVTELDRRAERLIAGSLAGAFPGDGLVAEEGTGRESTGGYRWVVDPLDGTTNYVAGLPMFSVSLGCLEDGAGAVLGVVHAPVFGETFAAIRGLGLRGDARGPGRPARPGPDDLDAAVFIVNKAYHPAPMLWAVAGGLMASVRAFRTFGCVSLDLALVAAGRADGLVLLPADPWDVAAGLLLVEEAGLVAGGLAGGPNPTGRQGILATRSSLFPPAAALLDPSPLPG